MNKSALDIFGKFLIENLVDKGFERFNALKTNSLKGPTTPPISEGLSELSTEQISLVESVVENVLISATHDFLFALEVESDFAKEVVVNVRGSNIAEISDGLQGELFSEDGWLSKYRKAD